jgi:hypothetical protein
MEKMVQSEQKRNNNNGKAGPQKRATDRTDQLKALGTNMNAAIEPTETRQNYNNGDDSICGTKKPSTSKQPQQQRQQWQRSSAKHVKTATI